jgi:hypothetical protein
VACCLSVGRGLSFFGSAGSEHSPHSAFLSSPWDHFLFALSVCAWEAGFSSLAWLPRCQFVAFQTCGLFFVLLEIYWFSFLFGSCPGANSAGLNLRVKHAGFSFVQVLGSSLPGLKSHAQNRSAVISLLCSRVPLGDFLIHEANVVSCFESGLTCARILLHFLLGFLHRSSFLYEQVLGSDWFSRWAWLSSRSVLACPRVCPAGQPQQDPVFWFTTGCVLEPLDKG